MTFEWTHRKLNGLNTVLRQFDSQLHSIAVNAGLCYHSQYSTFTIALYNTANTSASTVGTIKTEHLVLLSAFPITPKVEQLAADLEQFITTN